MAALIADYQAEAGITLHGKQIEALELANAHPCCAITGGAGTGKTTVLRGLFRICESAGYAVFPMALSGRAAKRIGEATGHKAQTIAGFLRHFKAESNGVVVIDEASMVDLPSAYRVLRHLPQHYRVVLVGDPNQLPPVGPGLLLHELAHHPLLPVVELSQISRYGGTIAAAAARIRDGEWPSLPDVEQSDIAFLPCQLDEINEVVLRLYDEDRSASQILCATQCRRRRHKCHQCPVPEPHQCPGRSADDLEPGVRPASGHWPARWGSGDLPSQRLGERFAKWLPRCLGVGRASRSRQGAGEPHRLHFLWDDGRTLDLTTDLLAHLELAYGITIHKAQGSGFARVIIPVRQSKLLDRTLLYTAVTRAEKQVVLVGDAQAARAAVMAPRHSDRRHVALGALLTEQLKRMKEANVSH